MSIQYGNSRLPDTSLCRRNTRRMAQGMKAILESQTHKRVPVRIEESDLGADVTVGPFRDKTFTVQLWFSPERRAVDARACLKEGRKKSCRTLRDVPVDALTSPAALFPWLNERLRHHDSDEHVARLIAETPTPRDDERSFRRQLREFREREFPVTRYTAQMFGVESLLDKDDEVQGRWYEGTPMMTPAHIPPAAMFTSVENKQKVQVVLVAKLNTDWIYDPRGGTRQHFMGRVQDEFALYRSPEAKRYMVAANGMMRRFLIGGEYRLAIDTVHSDPNGTLTVYISSYAPGDATHPALKRAAITALQDMMRQVATKGDVYNKLIFGTKGGTTLPPIAAMIEADWRNDRLKFYESIEGQDEITITEADAWMKHCIAKVYAKHQDLSRAFAICTAQGQKTGYYKKGTKDPTKKGKTRARSKAAQKGHRDVLKSYEQAKVAARKLRRRARGMRR